MTRTTIRVGQIAIEGLARTAPADAFGQRLQAAIGAALRQAPAVPPAAITLPRLRVSLHGGATEADVAAAVASALRAAIARAR